MQYCTDLMYLPERLSPSLHYNFLLVHSDLDLSILNGFQLTLTLCFLAGFQCSPGLGPMQACCFQFKDQDLFVLYTLHC